VDLRKGATTARSVRIGERTVVLLATALIAVVYYVSNPASGRAFDQTFTIAGALLSGRLGVPDPRPWLELVPGVDEHYSVFPLGAVLSVLPLAALAKLGLFQEFPGALLSSLQAGLLGLLADALAAGHGLSCRRRGVLVLFLLFGNWAWCNLVFAGAWQHALGFAMIGQMAALYFILVRRAPLLAGASYALALGNRVELLVVAPIYLALLFPPEALSRMARRARGRELLEFGAAPVALLLLTFAYNYARFQSILDFGYERIPYVQDEELYSQGLLSLKAIPANAHVMLLQAWKRIDRFPYYAPNGFGDSIFLCSPFLIYLFARRSWRSARQRAAWLAVALITFVLWSHGNPGGFQFGYRYAMTLLPWFLLILIEAGPDAPGLAPRLLEDALLIVSIAINAYAVFTFYWVTAGEYV
jgi:hypothetical protein